MKINISNRIDYVNEDSMLLTALTMNGMNALAQSRYRVEKACHIDFAAVRHRFDVVERIIKEAAKALKNDMDDVDHYFKIFDGLEWCLADMVLLMTAAMKRVRQKRWKPMCGACLRLRVTTAEQSNPGF